MKDISLYEKQLNQDIEIFLSDFLNKAHLDNFVGIEKKWIKKNLEFIYSIEPKDVILSVNPYYKIITYDKDDAGKPSVVNYIFLPKYLVLNKLNIHCGELDKADLFFNSLVNYESSFRLDEIIEEVTKNTVAEKKNLLAQKIHTMIKKFLSYQYLVIE